MFLVLDFYQRFTKLVMENIQPISYRPLRVDEIRLISLQPGKKADAIECKLEYEEFQTAKEQKYEALSYTWGSPDNLRTITLDNKTCQVRENLWWALFSLRKESEARRLWIDALVINQADVEERNKQVSQMDRIYKEASQVAVWLGRASEDDANALKYCWEISSKRDLPTHFDPCYAPREENNAWFRQHLSKWKDIASLCARVYWTRLWIIQEFSLATQVQIYYGDLSMDWRCARDVIYCLAMLQYSGDGEKMKDQITSSSLTRVLQGKVLMGSITNPKSMLELIYHHRMSICSEIRDKVFGLHSLSADCCRKAIPVDYTKSLPELCIGLLEHHLMQHGTDEFIPGSRVLQNLFLTNQDTAEKEETAKLIRETSSRIPTTFKAHAKYSSVITYASPSLDSLPVGYIEGVSSGVEEIYLSRALLYSIQNIDQFLSMNQLDKIAEWAHHHLDLIKVASWPVALETPASMSKINYGVLHEPLTQEDFNESLAGDEQIAALEALARIIRVAEAIAKKSHSATNCRLYLLPTGEIRLGPDTIAVGDWSVELDKFGPDIIVRYNGNGDEFETIGRGVGLFTDEIERRMLKYPIMTLDIGFETLVTLTSPEPKSERIYVA